MYSPLKAKIGLFFDPIKLCSWLKSVSIFLIATACHFATEELLTLWLSIALPDLFCGCPTQSSQS